MKKTALPQPGRAVALVAGLFVLAAIEALAIRRGTVVFRTSAKVAPAPFRPREVWAGFDGREIGVEFSQGRPGWIDSTLHRGGSGFQESFLQVASLGFAALARRRLNLSKASPRDGAVSAFHGNTSAITNELPPVGLGRTPRVWTIAPEA